MSDFFVVFIVPVASILVFIISLIIYKNEKKKLSLSENERDLNKLKNLHTLVSVSGIISAFFVAALVLLAGLFFLFMKSM